MYWYYVYLAVLQHSFEVRNEETLVLVVVRLQPLAHRLQVHRELDVLVVVRNNLRHTRGLSYKQHKCSFALPNSTLICTYSFPIAELVKNEYLKKSVSGSGLVRCWHGQK